MFRSSQPVVFFPPSVPSVPPRGRKTRYPPASGLWEGMGSAICPKSSREWHAFYLHIYKNIETERGERYCMKMCLVSITQIICICIYIYYSYVYIYYSYIYIIVIYIYYSYVYIYIYIYIIVMYIYIVMYICIYIYYSYIQYSYVLQLYIVVASYSYCIYHSYILQLYIYSYIYIVLYYMIDRYKQIEYRYPSGQSSHHSTALPCNRSREFAPRPVGRDQGGRGPLICAYFYVFKIYIYIYTV